MRKTGYPRLFFGKPEILGRFESWPVCPRRVRFRQSTNEYKEKAWGVFTVDARELGESDIGYASVFDDYTHATDRRFLEWLMDSDQHTDEVLVFPDHWWSLMPLIDSFVRSRRIDAFCIRCNRTHAHNDLVKKDDDPAERRSIICNRLYCPEGHLLMDHEVMRRIYASRPLLQIEKRKRHLKQASFDFEAGA